MNEEKKTRTRESKSKSLGFSASEFQKHLDTIGTNVAQICQTTGIVDQSFREMLKRQDMKVSTLKILVAHYPSLLPIFLGGNYVALDSGGKQVLKKMPSFSPLDSDRATSNVVVVSKAASAGLNTIDDWGAVIRGSKYVDFLPIKAKGGKPYFEIQIEGDSMFPILENGDTVYCSEVEDFTELKNGRIYVVLVNGCLMCKGLNFVISGANKGQVVLKSLNTRYSDIDIEQEDIEKVFQINKILRSFEG